jgi:anthranilate synthase component 2
MKVLMIDNYDSFTYNLVQYLGELGAEVEVVRNDQVGVDDVLAADASHIMLSPGPGTPDQAGISMAVIEALAGTRPILGVCLGHQSIGQVYGGKIRHAREIMHGKTSAIRHTGSGVFSGLDDPFVATRYHSLVVERDSLPECLEITAWTETADGEMDEIMGLRHRDYAVEGVQFHPESILTDNGHALLQNFLQQTRAGNG